MMDNIFLIVMLITTTIVLIICLIFFFSGNKNKTKDNNIEKESKYINIDIRKEERNVFFNSFISQLGKRLADLIFIGIITMIIGIIVIIVINYEPPTRYLFSTSLSKN